MKEEKLTTEGERFKAPREELDMKQGDFSEEISTTQGHISDTENDRKSLSERTIKLICLKNWGGRIVSEEWLQTGKGEMLNKMDATDLVLSHFGSIMGDASAQKKAVLSALVEMVYCVPDDKWDYIFNQFKNCLEEAHKGPEGD